MLKSKEYATVQREQARRKALDKKEKGKRIQEINQQPQPDAYKRTHAVTTFASNADLNMTSPIFECDAESEYSHMTRQPDETEDQVATRREYERRKDFVTKFKKIDQTTVSAIGLKSKASLGESAIEEVHGFSMLLRFRGNRDMDAFDRSKPLPITMSDESDESDDDSFENIDITNVESNRTGSTSKPQTAL